VDGRPRFEHRDLGRPGLAPDQETGAQGHDGPRGTGHGEGAGRIAGDVDQDLALQQLDLPAQRAELDVDGAGPAQHQARSIGQDLGPLLADPGAVIGKPGRHGRRTQAEAGPGHLALT